jgi:hypothetical protein
VSLAIILQYVDPGTGTLLAQLLFSFLIGVGFYLLTVRRRLMNFFKRQPTDKPADLAPQSEKTEPKED